MGLTDLLHFEWKLGSRLGPVGMTKAIKPFYRELSRIFRQCGGRAALERGCTVPRDFSAEYHNIEKGVRDEPVRTMDRHARRFALGHQHGDHDVGDSGLCRP